MSDYPSDIHALADHKTLTAAQEAFIALTKLAQSDADSRLVEEYIEAQHALDRDLHRASVMHGAKLVIEQLSAVAPAFAGGGASINDAMARDILAEVERGIRR